MFRAARGEARQAQRGFYAIGERKVEQIQRFNEPTSGSGVESLLCTSRFRARHLQLYGRAIGGNNHLGLGSSGGASEYPSCLVRVSSATRIKSGLPHALHLTVRPL